MSNVNQDYWNEMYGVAPTSNDDPASPGDVTHPTDPAAHIGPVADDYASIGHRLKQLEAEKATVQGHPLPEAAPVTLKPWWT